MSRSSVLVSRVVFSILVSAGSAAADATAANIVAVVAAGCDTNLNDEQLRHRRAVFFLLQAERPMKQQLPTVSRISKILEVLVLLPLFVPIFYVLTLPCTPLLLVSLDDE